MPPHPQHSSMTAIISDSGHGYRAMGDNISSPQQRHHVDGLYRSVLGRQHELLRARCLARPRKDRARFTMAADSVVKERLQHFVEALQALAAFDTSLYSKRLLQASQIPLSPYFPHFQPADVGQQNFTFDGQDCRDHVHVRRRCAECLGAHRKADPRRFEYCQMFGHCWG